MAGFVEFMYNNIVPSCFIAPLKDTFDLNDAQTILALSESASCLKTVLDKRGDEFVTYLQSQYLPTLNVAPDKIEEYCQALRSDPKAFKNYLKVSILILTFLFVLHICPLVYFCHTMLGCLLNCKGNIKIPYLPFIHLSHLSIKIVRFLNFKC